MNTRAHTRTYLHTAPHTVVHPVGDGVVHTHDLGAAQQVVKLGVLQLAALA